MFQQRFISIILFAFSAGLSGVTVSGAARAANFERPAGMMKCSDSAVVGRLCLARVSELRPTQIALGYEVVKQKRKKIKTLLDDPKELREYLKEKPEPAVLGPGRELYITDHHHLARALRDLDVEWTFVRISVDLSHLAVADFWKLMETRGWLYLYDEHGRGPLKYAAMPLDVKDMPDDPYRSLAGLVREEGGFAKTSMTYVEFLWAQFFRPRISLAPGSDALKKALPRAMELARSEEARHLPGYLGPWASPL